MKALSRLSAYSSTGGLPARSGVFRPWGPGNVFSAIQAMHKCIAK